jgi:hypothetical protein
MSAPQLPYSDIERDSAKREGVPPSLSSFNDEPSNSANSPVKGRAVAVVAGFALLVSIASLIYFYSNNMTNVYGDGAAHLNIARKVVDSPDSSSWQRYIQIGSPWLPLQTVLMLPLVCNDSLWRTGLAGSFVSMIFFVIAAVAIYLISQSMYGNRPYNQALLLPFVALGVFVLNPSAVYIQSTPMTEMVFIGMLLVSVAAFQRWAQTQTARSLTIAGLAMSVATLARYEAWPVALAATLFVIVLSKGTVSTKLLSGAGFAALTSLGPAYWLWHNWAIYSNALEFLTGPNSARGIYLQNQNNLGWSKIFVGHPILDVLLMLATVAVCAGPLLLVLAGLGLTAISAAPPRKASSLAVLTLLAIPFGFHVLSLYRGEIQVFPFSAFGLLNVRYGLPSLPLIAILVPGAVTMFARRSALKPAVVISAIVLLQYGLLLSDGPGALAVYQEGLRNGVNSKPARELAHASDYLLRNPQPPMILMQTGSLGPVVSKGGLRFNEVIHEGTARWHQVTDKIPADVSTIVIQDGDTLARKISASSGLGHDLDSDFQEVYRGGTIKIYRRIQG